MASSPLRCGLVASSGHVETDAVEAGHAWLARSESIWIARKQEGREYRW